MAVEAPGQPAPPSPTPSRSRRTTQTPARRSSAPRQGRLVGYLFIAPALLVVLAVVYYGVGYTLRISTLDWDGISADPESVGLGNYTRLLQDAYFWDSLQHMAVFSSTILIQMVLGFAFAVLLHSRIRGKGVYKSLVFLPVVLSPAVMAPVFRRILDADGEVNSVLSAMGLGMLSHPWLADPSTALYALIAINVWQWTGFSFLLYYAGLTQLNKDVLEAARLDGASTLRILVGIVLPLMRGTSLTLVILGVIGTVKTFDIPYLVTGGGPARSTDFLATYIYQQGVTNFHAGYGAALTVVLVGLSLLLTLWQVRRYRSGDTR